ncbi:alcohol dehydrogenase catalytic domain-containing protein [Cohnella nanjingensis]|uniref:alcohol dehydrogenase catalytic domain-containing protein n=1 Tax=Cohnella nanjingensis TaxID=1387779 RepID=UPI001C87E63A|nr:alcohol dehydrogenase catalytic domain-containing protein [Cohnella nanjingensis]
MIPSSGSKTIIQSKAYRLIQPHQIVESAIAHEVEEGQVVVEPSLGSICHADLRYYSGNRRPEALARKLPMALIHEGIGKIVSSGVPELQTGQRVVVVPNIPGYLTDGIPPDQCCPACRSGHGENYCHRGRFLGSGVDGLAQSRLVVPAPCAIPVPDEVPDGIAVLTELCSVSYQALAAVADKLAASKVAVFGDGPVGFLAAAVLHHVYGVERERLLVFGAIPEKLAQFDFATVSLVQDYDFSSGPRFDIAVECTGGRFSESAINQAIAVLRPGGQLILMGVTEDRVPINTRDVLEKGIKMRGSSRSSRTDFVPVLQAMKDAGCQRTLGRLLPERRTVIDSAEDFDAAMREAEAHRSWAKVLLDFRW